MTAKVWLKIGEAAAQLGVSPKELRYWESVIPEIRPRRSKGNLRYYHREELPRLAHIRDWLGEGLTVADCQQLLLTGQLRRGLGLELPASPAGPAAALEAKDHSAPASLEQARRALAELLQRLNALPSPLPRKRRRREPPVPVETLAAPDPAAPPPVAPEPPPKSAKPRRKPPTEPGDPTSFGPLFDLV